MSAQAMPTGVTNPHFARIGGEPVIRRLAERFYANMDALTAAQGVRALHPADLSRPKQTLFEFLVGWMGGPPLYAQKHGPARLGQKHRPFGIGDAERDAWMQCMDRALDEVVADEALRDELHQAFLKTATFLRNR
jgi:hemoglobin